MLDEVNLLTQPEWLQRFNVLRIGRTPFAGEPGIDGCELSAIEAALVEELMVRRNLKADRRATADGLSVNDWLKVTCYELILVWQATGWDEELDGRISQRFRQGTQRDDRNIFEEGIVGLFATSPRAISVRDRGRLADAMWYGFRHYIPPPLLNAFNAQFPGHKAKIEDWRQNIEPALDRWVIEQRTQSFLRECQLDTYRGAYPSRIEETVQPTVKSLTMLAFARSSPKSGTMVQAATDDDDDDW